MQVLLCTSCVSLYILAESFNGQASFRVFKYPHIRWCQQIWTQLAILSDLSTRSASFEDVLHWNTSIQTTMAFSWRLFHLRMRCSLYATFTGWILSSTRQTIHYSKERMDTNPNQSRRVPNFELVDTQILSWPLETQGLYMSLATWDTTTTNYAGYSEHIVKTAILAWTSLDASNSDH